MKHLLNCSLEPAPLRRQVLCMAPGDWCASTLKYPHGHALKVWSSASNIVRGSEIFNRMGLVLGSMVIGVHLKGY